MHGFRMFAIVFAAMIVFGEHARGEAPEVEIYIGLKKVSPKPKLPVDPTAGPRAVEAVANRLQTASSEAFISAGRIMNRLMERAVPKWELPHIPVVVNVTLPPPVQLPPVPASPIVAAGGFHQTGFSGAAGSSAPRLLPWFRESSQELVPVRSESKTKEEAQPTIIVVRESAPTPVQAPRVEEPGIRLSSEIVIAVFVVFCVALFATILIASVRSNRISYRNQFSQRPIPLGVRDGHVAVGGRDAGPMPDTTEKFDLGPSYAEIIQLEKAEAAAGESAMLQMILEQNLEMRAELAK